jgi:hypothetical protein
MFRGSIEAGGSPSWEEAQSGDSEKTHRISGEEVPTHGKSGEFAEGTNRRWGGWQPRFLAGGRAHARDQISSNWLGDSWGSRRTNPRGTTTTAARGLTAFRSAIAMAGVLFGVKACRWRERGGRRRTGPAHPKEQRYHGHEPAVKLSLQGQSRLDFHAAGL